MNQKGTTVRDLCKKYPELWTYDYKWKDSENYRDINEVLSGFGYKLACGEVKSGDYNDIKGYLNCNVRILR